MILGFNPTGICPNAQTFREGIRTREVVAAARRVLSQRRAECCRSGAQSVVAAARRVLSQRRAECCRSEEIRQGEGGGGRARGEHSASPRSLLRVRRGVCTSEPFARRSFGQWNNTQFLSAKLSFCMCTGPAKYNICADSALLECNFLRCCKLTSSRFCPLQL